MARLGRTVPARARWIRPHGSIPPQNFSGTVALSGSGTLTDTGIPQLKGTLGLSGSGTLTASGIVIGFVNLSGSGTLAFTGVPKLTGTIALSGSGTLTEFPLLVGEQGQVFFAGDGVLVASGINSFNQLTDTFQTKNLTKWSWLSGAGVAGGQLTLDCNSSSSGQIVTPIPWSLLSFSTSIELIQVPAVGLGTTETLFQLVNSTADANHFGVGFRVNNGQLICRYVLAGSWTNAVTPISYSATAHQWLRLRESGGTVLWETSPDYQTWTTRASMARTSLTGITFNALKAVIGTGYTGAETSPIPAIFDNFNLPALYPYQWDGGTWQRLNIWRWTNTGWVATMITGY